MCWRVPRTGSLAQHSGNFRSQRPLCTSWKQSVQHLYLHLTPSSLKLWSSVARAYLWNSELKKASPRWCLFPKYQIGGSKTESHCNAQMTTVWRNRTPPIHVIIDLALSYGARKSLEEQTGHWQFLVMTVQHSLVSYALYPDQMSRSFVCTVLVEAWPEEAMGAMKTHRSHWKK